MVCIYCQSETQVLNSRPQKRNNQVWRRRKCIKCENVFTTLEAIDYSNALSVATESVFKPFLTDLLYTEVLEAISHRKTPYIDAREITNTIVKRLTGLPNSPTLKPRDISQITAQVLKNFDKQAWHRYSANQPSVI